MHTTDFTNGATPIPFTGITEVETTKTVDLSYTYAVWLQAEVRFRGLGLRPRLYSGSAGLTHLFAGR